MQKGPEYFVEAASLVLQRARNIRFVMAGSGDMMDAMINLAAERGIADRFHFPGFMKGKQVYEVYKNSDVFVMPSVSEPFGIAPLEAMQCGTPSIIPSSRDAVKFLIRSLRPIIGTFMQWPMPFIPSALIPLSSNICRRKAGKKWMESRGKK